MPNCCSLHSIRIPDLRRQLVGLGLIRVAAMVLIHNMDSDEEQLQMVAYEEPEAYAAASHSFLSSVFDVFWFSGTCMPEISLHGPPLLQACLKTLAFPEWGPSFITDVESCKSIFKPNFPKIENFQRPKRR